MKAWTSLIIYGVETAFKGRESKGILKHCIAVVEPQAKNFAESICCVFFWLWMTRVVAHTHPRPPSRGRGQEDLSPHKKDVTLIPQATGTHGPLLVSQILILSHRHRQ